MSLNLSRHFSRMAFSALAIAGSVALLVSPKVVMADNPAPAAAPQTTAPAAPAAPAKKPVAMKKKPAVKKHVKKASYKGPSFAGRVVATDLSSSPATLVVSRTLGKKKGTIVFGGDLTSRTVIMKGHKRVKASAIKSGQRVVVHYRKAKGSLTVTSVWIR
jgi:hypothetical protein